eukprot:TRINITY_DN3875_c0_g1_i1.p1 TRINITY_DN3875_c0_g1~~TRINITY_DN3875_c0_g1_i1.p1  ORF type:complete len:309 (+),score=114.53 TRINITY_DN3875_c0_g1_i1:109-1035(+)
MHTEDKPWMNFAGVSPVRPGLASELAKGLNDGSSEDAVPEVKGSSRYGEKVDRKVVEDLKREHQEEIRRSDAVHARHCNDLTAMVEDLRSERDALRNENASLLNEVETVRDKLATHRGFKDGYASERKEKRVVGDRVDKLQQEAEEKEREIERLQYETSKLYAICQKQEADTKRAFQELKTEHDQVVAANRSLERRLQEATVDYKKLDANYATTQEQLAIGKTRFRDISEEHQRRERQFVALRRQVLHVDDMLAEMRKRADQRTTSGNTPIRELRIEFEEVLREMAQLRRVVNDTGIKGGSPATHSVR